MAGDKVLIKLLLDSKWFTKISNSSFELKFGLSLLWLKPAKLVSKAELISNSAMGKKDSFFIIFIFKNFTYFVVICEQN
jgi:hypothetical protein